MKRKCLSATVLILAIASFVGNTLSFQPFQKDQSTFNNYRIAEISHNGLRAFVKFTGQQIIIINNDAFDWTNVQFSVRAVPTFDYAASEIAHSLPRVKARGVYTIDPFWPVEANSPKGNEGTTRLLSLEIWCDTPEGKNFWAGRWQ
jgi:hypothetical protein